MEKYYRNQYIMAIYAQDEFDTLIAVLKNRNQFADYFSITNSDASQILHNFFTGKNKLFRHNGQLCEIHFIDMLNLDEDDTDELN